VKANLPTMTQIIEAQARLAATKYSWSLVRDSIDACYVFVGADEVIIRPLLPPTSSHAPAAIPP
jgi:hypothetical protein